ncbi:hypothetical protein RHDC4_00293 [Rhodocyclaceae bacterium]|nr:hypothetical protein RHDC4_00293 [Rhodocyclaceae bacterium]
MFYLDLFSALARHKVAYALIGGLAVSLHGVERATMDIDISVALAPDNLAALVEASRELGLVPVLPVPLENLGDPGLLRRWHEERHMEAFALRAPGLAGVTIDVLPFPPVDFAAMNGRAIVFDIGGVPVRVAAIDDLIALKRAVARPIDLADIDHLTRIKEQGA